MFALANSDVAMVALTVGILLVGLFAICVKCINTEARHEPDPEDDQPETIE